MTHLLPDRPKPIEREREVLVFANRHGELFNDDVVSPTGERGSYLRWRWGAHGVLAIPMRGDSLAFVPAYRYPVGRVLLEFPRGGADPGEPIVPAALRELREESGLFSEDGIELGQVHADTGLIESAVSVVLASISSDQFQAARPEAMESVGQPHWLTRDEARDAVAKGTVRCGLTLAALALLWSHDPSGPY